MKILFSALPSTIILSCSCYHVL